MSIERIRIAMAALLLSVLPLAAGAHTHLDHAEPAADAVLESAPKQVHLSFSSRIEARFSRIEVYAADGTQVDQRNYTASDNKRELTVDLAEDLPAGEYQVQWNVVARDGHRVRGDYKFNVK
ncbi:MAG: copper homeostasis periplasmic binding protein CopC [Gammaproteobacteria bacterium]|jgi:methionine-rich copper-binding protein CopC|nr:copper homeostasis periplasmic binding protein CopC [Gammaproteobacteria bacterium]